MVHDAHQALQTLLSRRTAGALAAAAALLCCLALLSGCGAVSQGSTLPATSSADVGESARSDTCAQWQAGSVAQRHGALLRLRKFASSPVGSSAGIQSGHVLGENEAYKLFQSFCSHRFARAFKLYKLYERAAAFLGH